MSLDVIAKGEIEFKDQLQIIGKEIKAQYIYQQTPEVRDMEEGQSTTYHKNLDW